MLGAIAIIAAVVNHNFTGCLQSWQIGLWQPAFHSHCWPPTRSRRHALSILGGCEPNSDVAAAVVWVLSVVWISANSSIPSK